MKPPRIRDYPRTWLIHHCIWHLKFKRSVDENHEKNKDTLGLCDPSSQTLYIRLNQVPRETLETFIHEVLHAFEEEYEVQLGHRVINKLEKAIADFILNNF